MTEFFLKRRNFSLKLGELTWFSSVIYPVTQIPSKIILSTFLLNKNHFSHSGDQLFINCKLPFFENSHLFSFFISSRCWFFLLFLSFFIVFSIFIYTVETVLWVVKKCRENILLCNVTNSIFVKNGTFPVVSKRFFESFRKYLTIS